MANLSQHQNRILDTIASLINKRKFKQAMQLASISIKSHPKNPKIYALFTSALRQSNEEKRALTFVLTALQQHPKSLELHIEYLLLLYEMREYEKFRDLATQFCEQIVQLPQSKLQTQAIQDVINQLATSALTVPYFTSPELAKLHQAGSKANKISTKKNRSALKFGDTVKIGIFSSQICHHVVGRFFTGFAAQVAHYPWDVTLYYDISEREDRIRVDTIQLMKSLGIRFREIDLKERPSEARKIIKRDGPHLILELAGRYDGSYRKLFSERLAPVQASWIGYPQHPGFPVIDYFLTDRFCQPENLTDDAEKRTYRFKRLFTSFDSTHLQKLMVDSPIRDSSVSDRVRFVSLNHARKLNREVLRLWSRILASIPHSTITFKSKSITAYQEEWILSQMIKFKIEPERVRILRDRDTQDEHLSFMRNVDIALDPFPYNGTTTTCDALYMGVPTITLLGEQHVSRVTGAMLAAVGCNELIAQDEDDYVRIAVNLAGDRRRLKKYRTTLRKKMLNSELCDSRGMADAMQNFIEDVLFESRSSNQQQQL